MKKIRAYRDSRGRDLAIYHSIDYLDRAGVDSSGMLSLDDPLTCRKDLRQYWHRRSRSAIILGKGRILFKGSDSHYRPTLQLALEFLYISD